MKPYVSIGAAGLIALTGALVTHAQPRVERVQFAAGATAKEITGHLKGDQDIDYLVGAAAGQTLTVTLKASNRQNYFNVLAPGSEAAMFVGSMSGDSITVMLPDDGDYRVRVYLMRAAARRNESTTYTLTIGVTGKPLAPLAAAQDARVPGTRFHASASVTCTTMIDPQPRSCEAFVVRRGRDGTGTVEVRGREGYTRRILFMAGTPVSSDAADRLVATRKGDVTSVTIGTDERFEIPDALIFGG